MFGGFIFYSYLCRVIWSMAFSGGMAKAINETTWTTRYYSN